MRPSAVQGSSDDSEWGMYICTDYLRYASSGITLPDFSPVL